MSRFLDRIDKRWHALTGGNTGRQGRVAINRRPIRSSWGGGNQWADQLTHYLRRHDFKVQFSLAGRVDCIILADHRPGPLVPFGPEEVQAYKVRHPEVRCLYRINNSDLPRRTSHIDAQIAAANKLADHTVFLSSWLRDYHAAKWFNPALPHSVIANGAEPSVFHPGAGAAWLPGQHLKLVTHHWSDNWLKGFRVYQALDSMIADGKLSGIEFWVIGRWPREIRWRAARTFGPVAGPRLAALLRQCHAYLTAAQWESGSMHFIEAAQCGLPVLYHADGGGIVEFARQYGIGFRDDLPDAIDQLKTRYAELKRAVSVHAPSGEKMCCAYLDIVRQLIRGGADKCAAPVLQAP